VPFWAHYGFVRWRNAQDLAFAERRQPSTKLKAWHDGFAIVALSAAYLAVLFGLHKMHFQHVDRQFCLAAARLESSTVPMPAGVDTGKLSKVCGLTLAPRALPQEPALPHEASR
jgi:hypothetical protein